MSFCSFVLNAPKNCNLLTELVYLKRKENGKETNKDDESPFTKKKKCLWIYIGFVMTVIAHKQRKVHICNVPLNIQGATHIDFFFSFYLCARLHSFRLLNWMKINGEVKVKP